MIADSAPIFDMQLKYVLPDIFDFHEILRAKIGFVSSKFCDS